MRFVCCGVVYSTEDPETYSCINTYVLKKPFKPFVDEYKICKEIAYTLFCKKNGCLKVFICRFAYSRGSLIVAQYEKLKGEKGRKYLERTKMMRIKQPQRSPIQMVPQSRTIPWVYGKSIDGYTQVPRYIDESGNRDVFKNNSWQKDIIKLETVVYKA